MGKDKKTKEALKAIGDMVIQNSIWLFKTIKEQENRIIEIEKLLKHEQQEKSETQKTLNGCKNVKEVDRGYFIAEKGISSLDVECDSEGVVSVIITVTEGKKS